MAENCVCKECAQAKACEESALSWLFLFVGLLATIAVRVVNLVGGFGPFWPKFFWYIGVIGFFIYFLYAYLQHSATHKAIDAMDLARRLSHKEPLKDGDYAFLNATMCKLRSTKERFNYFFIFITSALALLIALYQDFLS